MENDKKSDSDQNKEWAIVALVFAILGFLAFLFHKVIPQTKVRISKTDKGELIKIYNVNKKTFAKWVQFFCNPQILSIESYRKKRRLTDDEVAHIFESFGFPSEETPALSKGQIIEITEGCYKSLRGSVLYFSEKFGISQKAYQSLNVFPPRISQNMIKRYS